MAQVKVLVVDDEWMIRAGLRLLLEGSEDLRVVGEAGNGREALTAASELRPDVVLMDIRMPVLDGLEATAALLEADPDAKVLILTTFDNDATVLAALSLGAVGFLLKDTEPTELVSAVRQAAQGRIPLSPTITRQLVAAAVGQADTSRRDRALGELGRLTEREREIALAVASGATNLEIAEALFVSLATVKTHLSSAMLKLGATNRVQVALRCYEAALL
jgi:DNA-binding NarL/FixJ family response regulator